jgi:hypothetical protein
MYKNLSLIKGKDLGAVQKYLRELENLGLNPTIEPIKGFQELTENRDYQHIRIRTKVSKEDLETKYLLGLGGYSEIFSEDYKELNKGSEIIFQSPLGAVFKESFIPRSTKLLQEQNGRKTLIQLVFEPKNNK